MKIYLYEVVKHNKMYKNITFTLKRFQNMYFSKYIPAFNVEIKHLNKRMKGNTTIKYAMTTTRLKTIMTAIKSLCRY